MNGRRFLVAVFIAAAAAAVAATSCAPSGPREIWTEPVTGMAFVRIDAGEFLMGAPEGEAGRGPGETQHRVRLSHEFYLARHEVTQAEWSAVMRANPSQFATCGPACPVDNVSWFEAQSFIERLTRLSSGERFRLPTEAEWEYACRAGTATPFATGKNITTAKANFDGRYPYRGALPSRFYGGPTPVGRFAANPWGLFDMHGNVWEWCEDEECPYPSAPTEDPVGRCGSEKKILRGGSWYFNAESARSALRYTHTPGDRGMSVGFRLVRVSPSR